MQDVLVLTDDDGMPCIISSLPPDNQVRVFSKIVDYLTLALVTPLKSVNDRVHKKMVAWR